MESDGFEGKVPTESSQLRDSSWCSYSGSLPIVSCKIITQIPNNRRIPVTLYYPGHAPSYSLLLLNHPWGEADINYYPSFMGEGIKAQRH